MKKTVISVVPTFYHFSPASAEGRDPVSFAEQEATELLDRSMFLRDGRDENVRYLLTFGYVSDTLFTHREKQETSPILL